MLKEGIVLPSVTGLAWLDGDSSGMDRFVSATADGIVRIWNIGGGKPHISEAHDFQSIPVRQEFPVHSPDGSKMLLPSPDGAVCLLDTASGKELARYYSFGPAASADVMFADLQSADCKSDEWICVVPEGFYNASFRGDSFIELRTRIRRYSMDQLSGALFRPDLFSAYVLSGAKPAPPVTLEILAGDRYAPPDISLSFESEGRELKITITEQNGGAGWLALYRRAGDTEIPAGLFDIAKSAEKRYTEKDRFGKQRESYEIRVSLAPRFSESDEIGVSAFNRDNTVESGRHWLNIIPEGNLGSDEPAGTKIIPALRLFLAAGDEGREEAEILGDFLSLQAEGGLYSTVEARNIFDEEFAGGHFIQTLKELCAGADKNDAIIFYIRGRGRVDPLGNLSIDAEGLFGEIAGEEILGGVLGSNSDSLLLLLDIDYDMPPAEMEAALLRFRQRLGPRAMLAAFGIPGNRASLVHSVIEGLGPNFAGTRYIDTSEFFARTGEALASQGSHFLAFHPREHFALADAFINSGELKFQTMASGMLTIDRVDKTPVPIAFGQTMSRTLPPGNYIIDMVYRNGYRETRIVELRRKDSAWVLFNYLPPSTGNFAVGSFQGNLPSLGINISELNPANYQRINREAMEGMGMAPSYVAFLSGENLYRQGDFDKAIAEYSRAISLRADYADAYVSRGNARRKKGKLDRAIEDYTRALSLRGEYAEVYNYRGFMYAQKGDINRAIEDYTRAIRYRADYADAYFNRAHAYAKQGNWNRAIADYTQVIRFEPSNAVAHNERGNAWRSSGDESKAAADFEVARMFMRN
jgi:Flp pilus assembly protein TadD